MNCTKCGAPLTGNDQFCRNCGAPVMNMQTNQGGYVQPQNNGGAINNLNYGENYNKFPQKNNMSKYIIIGLAVVIVILIGVLIFFLVNNKNNTTSASTDKSDNNAELVQTSNESSYKVNLGNFTLSIPDDLIYQRESNLLIIGDEAGTWAAQFGVYDGSYTQLNKNKAQFTTLAQQDGATATPGVEKTLGGVEFITTEYTYGGNNYLIAYAKGNAMYLFGVQIMNLDNEFDYDVLEKYIAPIVTSATYSDVATNIEFNSNVDLSSFNSLIK